MSVLEQGDIIEVDFNPSMGHEPAKSCPAIVVTDYSFNSRSSLVGVVPIQSTNNGYPLHVPVDEMGLHGFACVEMARNIDVESRGCRHIGYADDKTMRTIMSYIRGMYGLR